MATPSEQQILEDLKRLESGQPLSRSDPSYMKTITERWLLAAEGSSVPELTGQQTQEEQGHQTQRGEESRYSGMAGGWTDEDTGEVKPNIIDVEQEEILRMSFESSMFGSGRVNQIDLLMEYIQKFPRENLTQKFWASEIIPVLRHTIGRIFTTQGDGTWKRLGSAWGEEKVSPALPGISIGGTSKTSMKATGGGSRILHWRGKYRRALTGRTLNQNGNIFRPLLGGNWKSGFEYEADGSWFQDYSRRARGDDLEAGYPSKFEEGSEGQFRFISHIPENAQHVLSAFGWTSAIRDLDSSRIIVTTKAANKLEKFGVQSYLTYDFRSTQGRGKNRKGKQGAGKRLIYPRDRYSDYSIATYRLSTSFMRTLGIV